MAQFDLPIAELRTYQPQLDVPANLDRFWTDTLADARSHDLAPTFTAIDNGLA
ncbi:MAG: acetylxylan esterase, partial [Acidimicrobiales bacterium]